MPCCAVCVERKSSPEPQVLAEPVSVEAEVSQQQQAQELLESQETRKTNGSAAVTVNFADPAAKC